MATVQGYRQDLGPIIAGIHRSVATPGNRSQQTGGIVPDVVVVVMTGSGSNPNL